MENGINGKINKLLTYTVSFLIGIIISLISLLYAGVVKKTDLSDYITKSELKEVLESNNNTLIEKINNIYYIITDMKQTQKDIEKKVDNILMSKGSK